MALLPSYSRLFLLSLAFTSTILAQSPSPTQTTTAPTTAPTAGYCYYPGSSPQSAQNDRPCDPDAETSMCCPNGWTCMSNKICQVTDGRLAQASVGSIRRATCTDPRWNGTVCGDFCLDLPGFELEGDLTPCGDNVFVCSAYARDGSANCAAKQKVFTLPTGSAQTIIALPTGTTATSMIPVSTARSMTFLTSARASSSSAAQVAQDEDGNDSSKTRTIAIAAGVGGGVALVAGLGLIFCCLRRRRARAHPSKTYSTTSSVEKPAGADYDPYDPPAGATAAATATRRPVDHEAPDTDEHDGRPRYTLFDDGETEISSVPPPVVGGSRPSGTPPRVQRPEVGRRDILRHAPSSQLDASDGSRVDLLGSDVGRTPDVPVAGRVSPLSEGGRTGVF